MRGFYPPLPAQPIIAHLAEELSIALHAPEGTNRQHARAVDREERACHHISHVRTITAQAETIPIE